MNKESIILITNNSNKKYILQSISKNHKLYNIKFFSFEELKKKLFFDYNNSTLEYIIKTYNVNINIAKTYLNNMYFLKEIDNEKVRFLNNLKSELEENNLLIINNNFKSSIQNKKVIVYGYNALSLEQELILKSLGVKYELENNTSSNYIPVVYEAKDISEEVEFVAIKISELLENNISIKNIKIIISEEYQKTIKRYFKLYNIPLNIKGTNPFYSTFIASEFLNNYEELSIEENILSLKENYNNVNDLITIINKSVLVKDKNIRKEFIINDLKNTKIPSKVYDLGIECTHLTDSFSDSDYVFLLGFNINSYPKIAKDDDYLSDKIKEELGIDTSTRENKNSKNEIISSIKNIKNLIITYKLHSASGSSYPSLLIEEIDAKVIKMNFDRTKSYSKLNSKLLYAKDLDNFYKFNIISEDLSLYKNNLDIAYREYNNSFTGINNVLLKEKLNNELVLSYTNMEMYNECAFKYYISKILKIDSFDETFKTIVGSITHHILELGLIKDIDINVEIIKFVKEKEYSLNKREMFYLEKLSLEIKLILDIIKKQSATSKLNKYLFEEELYVYKDRKDINITFKGLIDKVMYNEFNGRETLAVVDYKTGNTQVTLNNLEYGLNIQLPIYLYLLKKSERFSKADIAGFYIEKVLDNIPNINPKKTLLEIKEENLRLQGYSNRDEDILERLDEDYLESKLIKGLRFKKDGSLYSTAKVLTSEEMEEVIEVVDRKIDECIDNILKGEFNINPKVINNKNIACSYCKFKDICYMTKNDEIILGGEENELDAGASACN